MSNEELGQLFSDYNRVLGELQTQDESIIEGLNQLNGAFEHLTNLHRVPETTLTMPELHHADMLVQHIRRFQDLLRRKGELEGWLSGAGYRAYIQPTPMTKWTVEFPESR